MNGSRLIYRSRQFWQAFSSHAALQDDELLKSILSEDQIELFRRMQKNEQVHSLLVLEALIKQGEQDPDLLSAALLHDVGKSRMPLRIWERVIIVIVHFICRDCVYRWGSINAELPQPNFGWRKAFMVAVQHPKWGAEMAASSGVSPRAVALIARHQDKISPKPGSREDELLQKLQAVDDNH
jgi:putative nucleotidyltransferase with HDIG domain